MDNKEIVVTQSGKAVDIEPGQSWEIDLFRPEDAPGVSRLFRTVYRDNYPVKTFIDLQRLTEENAALNTISILPELPGDIVGHCSLFRSAPFRYLYEAGAGTVLPSYRGGSIASKLLAPPNWDGIQLYTERAKTLLQMIREDRRKCESVPR